MSGLIPPRTVELVAHTRTYGLNQKPQRLSFDGDMTLDPQDLLRLGQPCHLRGQGLRVSLLGQVDHHRVDGFRYQPVGAVDWMVCDMVEQPRKVAERMATWFREGWCRNAVFNLKLPMKKRWQETRLCLDRFAAQAGKPLTIRARQLYHDREEITVVGHLPEPEGDQPDSEARASGQATAEFEIGYAGDDVAFGA